VSEVPGGIEVRFVAVIGLLVGGLLIGSIASALADDRSICGAAPPKSDTIPACSRIIASPRTSDHDRALAYTFRADAMRTQDNAAGAVTDYGEALTLLPEYLPALCGRAGAYRSLHQYELALRDLDKALATPSQSPALVLSALYAQRGAVYRAMGDTARAIPDLDNALKISPRNAKALYQRGLAKSAMGDQAGGEADIAAAKAIDPDVATHL